MNATLVEIPQPSSRDRIRSQRTRIRTYSLCPNPSQVIRRDEGDDLMTAHDIPVSDPLATVVSRVGPAGGAPGVWTL